MAAKAGTQASSKPRLMPFDADIRQQPIVEFPQGRLLMKPRMGRYGEVMNRFEQEVFYRGRVRWHPSRDFGRLLIVSNAAPPAAIKEDFANYTKHEKNFGMRSINLDYLRTFVDVIELGSFSAAAERLNLSQPAVSLQIRQLEKRVGVSLIERVGRKARPTAAGSELLGHARQIDAVVAAALDGMARHATGVMGRLRLGTGATACIFLLPPVLRDLRRRFPTLEIIVSTGNTADIVKAVEENTIDIGFVTMPASGRSLEITPVLDDEFVLIALPDMQLPARITPSALAELPVLLFEPGGNTRRIADEWFARGSTALKPIMSLGSVEAIKALVGAGFGCAILPRMAVRYGKDQGSLVVRSLSPKLHRKLAIVIRRDKPLYRGLKELVRALEDVCKSTQTT
jgi:DNA-binding transcriptional LysR family regulator